MGGMRIVALFLLMLAGTLPVAGSDADLDGIPDALEDSLLQQFAPVVYLHPDDWNRPGSAEWVVDYSSMFFQHGLCPDSHAVQGGDDVDLDNLLQFWHHGGGLCLEFGPVVYSGSYRPGGRWTGFALNFEESTRGGSPQDQWTTYGHVYPGQDGRIVVQYWFFFPYNNWNPALATHEGDWEHISVILGSDLEPVEAFYANHNSGKVYDWNLLDKTGDHPKVFTAKGSHASYRAPNGNFCVDGYRDIPYFEEYCSEVGTAWTTWTGAGVVNVGERENPRPGFDWIQYTGLWGKANLIKEWSGPQGFVYQPESWHRFGSAEICDNDIDDDIDGAVDENENCDNHPDFWIAELDPSLAGNGPASSTTVDPGEWFDARVSVENLGIEHPGTFEVDFYLSLDSEWSADDIQLSTPLVINGLGATSGTKPLPTMDLQVPHGTPAGVYWLIGRVDVDGVVVEADESNNTTSSTSSVKVLGPPNPEENLAAAENTAGGTVLYRVKENFSDGVAQGFLPIWGTWDAGEEALFGTGEWFGVDDTMFVIYSPDVSYTMEFLVGAASADSPNGLHFGAVLRHFWIDEFLRLDIRQPVGESAVLELVNMELGNRSILAGTPIEANFFEQSYAMRITDNGCRLSVEIGGELVLDTSYTSNVRLLERGFYVNYDDTILFDNFVFEAISIDADGDGYGECAGDCDDSLPTVHPGASEVCGNNRDDDCDGAIDEGCGPSCRKLCFTEEGLSLDLLP